MTEVGALLSICMDATRHCVNVCEMCKGRKKCAIGCNPCAELFVPLMTR